MTNFKIFSSIPQWRFWTALGFQLVLVFAIPSQAFYTYISGKTVILQTRPVDPYDWMRGYSQTLRYDISTEDNLKSLRGWEQLAQESEKKGDTFHKGKPFYVILEAPKTPSTQKPPLAWKAVAISAERPQNLPSNQVAIEGKMTNYGWWIDYGIETYYFPEAKRNEINAAIEQLQANQKGERPFVVEVKIDAGGNAVPVGLWIGEQYYRF
ncbi:GDYXXLXY domain-containing protein [Gloeothece verrucosa]|uniref:Membrane-anchored protein n=1 Tax=Gloeothece verrucosa (strain PCC 7822) TaxID=497965 RepID=E0UE49_GLOV7|nr:GDYXXLXY domain-containing protein [Gloeothece verrucosa]ADN14174.1 conserved hypothetical protein [Gloeothece verrucosa PCC 7822]